MIWVSASRFVGHVPYGNLAHDCRMTWCESIRQMCEGSTSRTVEIRFQLESLILAQNERWRQA